MFRAEVGIGPGLGVDVHLSGLAHTGALAALFPGVGYVYGRPVFWGGWVVTLPGFHWSAWTMPLGSGKHALYEHSNLGLLPPLTAGVAGPEVHSRPWAVELAVAAGVVFLRLGVDPPRADDEDSQSVRSAEDQPP